tara:strand:+ start:4068 stop:4232 length:165 start_codon:yes stop_codon:yes gene_type:complete
LGRAQIEFVRLLGHEPVEYNQEQAKIRSYDGKMAIIRSFPVRRLRATRLPHARR